MNDAARSLAPGTRIGAYEIGAPLGKGGMGVVYRAIDTKLDRTVAIKFLSDELANAVARRRFQREAQMASSLNHPHILTVHDVGEFSGQQYLITEFVDGGTLTEWARREPRSWRQVAELLIGIADALATAHDAGILHRDIKPDNILITKSGYAKLADFGLAKLQDGSAGAGATRALTLDRTEQGVILGTVAYMSPEQALGKPLDRRSDVFSFGVVLYELLVGRRPFSGASHIDVLHAIAHRPIEPLPRGVPPSLRHLVDKALEKDPADRFPSMHDIVVDLRRVTQHSDDVPLAQAAKRWWATIAAVALVAAAIPGAWFVWQNTRIRWASEQALPQIEQLSEREDYVAAFHLAQEAKRYIPTDPVWKRIDSVVSRKMTVRTTPPGATVSYRPVGSKEEWTRLGLSPIVEAAVPGDFLEWRFEKPGYVTQSDAAAFVYVPGLTFDVTFHTPGQTPPGMVYVTAGDEPQVAAIAGLDHLPPQRLRDFWIDQYEVTNREFKRFVDAGGCRDPKYWNVPIVDAARTLTFEQAMARFTDSTRRPGPATWESGSFLEGQDDLPVTGVSWYEASAYAAFAGKSLPTIFHWSRVADQRMSGVVAPRSNFRGKGLMNVGASGGMNRYGAFDLAGNVKEWCWNRADASRRYILGGAWDEPAYLYNSSDARAPLERAANFGFRGVKYSDDDTVARTGELVAFEGRDFRKEKPVSDEVFATYRTLYDYDRGDLATRVDSTDDSNPDWRVERVSFNAAYGHERVPALLYLPKQGHPPYQTLVYFPGALPINLRSSSELNIRNVEWAIKSGRALVHPIYKSTFERGDEIVDDFPKQTNAFREHAIDWAKDVRRSVDYLETRTDIDRGRLAYMGYSWGAAMAPIYVSMEPRFKAAVLILPGFYSQRAMPEADAINFAPRMRIPTLMLNGHFDFDWPEDTNQVPMFNLLGTSADQKRRVVYDTGHNIPRPDMIRESLDWLDRYLGPVR